MSYIPQTGATSQQTRIVTADTTATSSDGCIIVRKTTGSPTTITLPSGFATSHALIIKDGKGDAATNAITITASGGLIDGQSSVTLSVSYGAITVTYDGTGWNVVGRAGAFS